MPQVYVPIGASGQLGPFENVPRQELGRLAGVARERRDEDLAMLPSRLRARKRLRLQREHAVALAVIVHRLVKRQERDRVSLIVLTVT